MELAAKRMNALKRLERFSQDGQLPSIPQIMFRIREVADDPKSGVADLANLILSDHQLTTRVLRMANSAYYGEYAGKVTRVTQAVALMGFRSVRNAAMALAVYSTVEKLGRCPRFDFALFWSRSIGAGVIGKQLAMSVGAKMAEEAFIAGFLHDIGQPLLATVFPDEYDDILSRRSQSLDITELELATLGISHLEAGGWVARKWRLPQNLIGPIEEHHRTNMPPKQKSPEHLTDIVYVADKLYPFVMSPSSQAPQSLEIVKQQTKWLLGMEPESIEALIEGGRAMIVEIASELNVQIKEAFEGATFQSLAEVNSQLAVRDLQLSLIQNLTDQLTTAESPDAALDITIEAAHVGLELGNVLLFAVSPDLRELRGMRGFGSLVDETLHTLTIDSSDENSPFYKSVHFGKIHAGRANLFEFFPHFGLGTESRMSGDIDYFAVIPLLVAGACRFVAMVTSRNPAEQLDEQKLRTLTVLASQCSLTLERLILREMLSANSSASKPVRV